MEESSSSLPRNTPRIPQELIDIAIDLLHDDHTTLKSCSLICSSTLHICRKFLFRRIIIDIFDLPTKLGASQLDRFAQFWGQSPHLVQYVEEFHIKYIPQSILPNLFGALEPFRDQKLKRFSLEAPTGFMNPGLNGSLESLLNCSMGELTHLRLGDITEVPRNLFGRFEKLRTLVVGSHVAVVPIPPPEDIDDSQIDHEDDGDHDGTDEQPEDSLAVNEIPIDDAGDTDAPDDDTIGFTKPPLEGLHLLSDIPDDTLNFLAGPDSGLDLTKLRRLTSMANTSFRADLSSRYVLFHKAAATLEFLAYEPSILGLHLAQPSILDLRTMPNLRHFVPYIQQYNGDVNFVPWLNDHFSALPPVNSLLEITIVVTFLNAPMMDMVEGQGWHRLDEILAGFENLQRCRFICFGHDFGQVESMLQRSMVRLKEKGILGIRKTSAASVYPNDNSFEHFELDRDWWP
ncbi:hypothetical protein BDN72DRAFT_957047 [Pluteus cervinus]|uniref:Uncharacterized protein n=1 Tax=Pluteus cervinus TaxID=181527 RepID=A0ACD3B5F8_9AGAR|nr:hypothetical protein BDN72DRAFT_957047 [Pluteus cervinus]